MSIDTDKLITLLTTHKNDVDTFFTFFSKNQDELTSAFNLLSQNPLGIAAVLDSGRTPQGRKKLSDSLHDNDAKTALNFLLAHPDEIETLSNFVSRDRGMVGSTLEVLTNHGSELGKIAKFVAAHPMELKKLSEISARDKGAPGKFLADAAKDPSLTLFCLVHHKDIKRIVDLASSVDIDGLNGLNAKDMGDMQSSLQFLLQHKDELGAVGRGLPAVYKQFAPAITQKQTDTSRAAEQQRKKQQEAAEMSKEQTIRNAAWEKFAKDHPQFYEEAVKLQQMEIKIAEDSRNPLKRGNVSAEVADFHKSSDEFNKDAWLWVSPVISCMDFSMQQEALVETAMALGRQSMKKPAPSR